MANRRVKVVDAIVNPAVLPGFSMLADTATVTATGKYVEVSFPCKAIWAVLTSADLDVDAEKIVVTRTVSNDVGTVRFTATTASSNTFSYIIIYSVTEGAVTALSTADDTTYTVVG